MSQTVRGCVWKQCLVAALFVLLGFAVSTSFAHARTAYIARASLDTLTLLDFTTVASEFSNPASYSLSGTSPAGGISRGIAVSLDAQYLYVANFMDDQVSVVRTSDNSIVDTIPLAGGGLSSWRYPAITPDGEHVYISNYSTDRVAVIRTSDNTVETYIDVGDEPRGIAVSPDGSRAFVANFNGDSLSVIDTSTNTVITTYPLTGGDGPYDVAITPDGTTLYVTNFYLGEVWALRASDGAVQDQVTAGTQPHGVAIGPDGDRAYVANYGSSNLSIIDTSTNTEVAGSPVTIAAGATPEDVAVSPDGQRAFVTCIDAGGNQIGVVDTVGVSLITTLLPGGGDPWGIVTTPNQRPIAALTVENSTAGSPASLDASGSSDSDGSVATYDWDFGDGATDQTSTATTTHTYSSPGTYQVTVRVTDNEGASAGAQAFTGQGAYFNSPGSSSKTVSISVSAASGGDSGSPSNPDAEKLATKLTAGFVKKRPQGKGKRAKRSAKSKTYTVRRAVIGAGKKMAFRGKLKTKSGGNAVKGATIYIQRRPVYSKAWRSYKKTKTSDKGNFSVVARAKATSHVRAVYRGGTGYKGSSAYTRLSKRPAVSISLPSRVKSGNSIRISGRIKGASKRTTPVALQFKRDRGGWRTFHMVSASGGAFSTQVPLSEQSQDYKIQLRAKTFRSYGGAFNSASSGSKELRVTAVR